MDNSKNTLLKSLLAVSFIAIIALGAMTVSLRGQQKELKASVESLNKEISDLKGVDYTITTDIKDINTKLDTIKK